MFTHNVELGPQSAVMLNVYFLSWLEIYVSKAEAIRLFSDKHEVYKVGIIKESKQQDNFQKTVDTAVECIIATHLTELKGAVND